MGLVLDELNRVARRTRLPSRGSRLLSGEGILEAFQRRREPGALQR
jgi:hypothetical protein